MDSHVFYILTHTYIHMCEVGWCTSLCVRVWLCVCVCVRISVCVCVYVRVRALRIISGSYWDADVVCVSVCSRVPVFMYLYLHIYHNLLCMVMGASEQAFMCIPLLFL